LCRRSHVNVMVLSVTCW